MNLSDTIKEKSVPYIVMFDVDPFLSWVFLYCRVQLKHGPIYHNITYGTVMVGTERNQTLNPKQTSHTSPSQASYANGVSIMRILN